MNRVLLHPSKGITNTNLDQFCQYWLKSLRFL